MFLLPFIGHSVAVGVNRHGVVGGIGDESLAVVLGVDDSLSSALGGSAVAVLARACLLDDTPLNGVAVHGSGVGEHRLVCCLARLHIVYHIGVGVVGANVA